MANLSAFDAAVLLVYLVGVVGVGLWLGRGQKDAKAYMLGGNDAPWWAILGSIVATETSTVTFLSVPGIAFAAQGDLRFLQLAMGFIVGRLVIAKWLLPYFFQGQIFTVYELLFERFGRGTQQLASVVFLITRNLGDGLRLFLTAVVLEATLGWPIPVCVIAIGIATIVFTFVGGMRSVIWNDCIQLVIYMIGGVIAFLLIVGRLDGGFGGLMEFARESGRLRVFDFQFFDDGVPRFNETYTFWAGLIGGAFLTLGTHGTDQMMVQRLLASRSQRDAGRALALSGVVVFLQFLMFLFVGIALACFYTSHPPDVPFASLDRVLSTYIVNEMPAGIGLIGLLLAAVFSTAMSTLSSSLNSAATTVVNDWILPVKPEMSSRSIVLTTKVLTVVFGAVQIGIGIWASNFDESVVSSALAIAGFASGLLLGLFAIGLFIPKANQSVAITGLAGGLLVLVVVKFGFGALPETSSLSYKVAWPWFPVIGSVSTFVVGWVGSRLLQMSKSRTETE